MQSDTNNKCITLFNEKCKKQHRLKCFIFVAKKAF